MNARDARRLAESRLQTVVTDPLMSFVLKRIKAAAEAGHFKLAHPFYGYDKLVGPPPEVCTTVLQRLTALGYRVTHHTILPSSDPREADWDEISW